MGNFYNVSQEELETSYYFAFTSNADTRAKQLLINHCLKSAEQTERLNQNLSIH